ncbi:transposase zinc-binding domain-containing protein [Aliiglaciecola sp. LCG003]|uniref:IS91 family transposase n=1 Tax=Aliiglaciecola sp. LCG003 TaxID=3053655 RepID=UPI0025722FD2|nr:transposase zinc-binding domain-containing protein [Aliiglaciecola sp. LCG003]WJG09695.1 transposase zinc-binding domain-containing protein [Aliiglaciecola sp. LCG003]
MPRNSLEVADILRIYGAQYKAAQQGHFSLNQLKVMSAIQPCRSGQLGGHLLHCPQCDTQLMAYNSCRNRHCPKCQSSSAKRWLEARQTQLLPTEYYHVVFTLPAAISQLAFYNKSQMYHLSFKAASQTLLTIAKDPKRLGAQIAHDHGIAYLGLRHDSSSACALYCA